MPWQDEMLPVVRVLVDDTDEDNARFSDDRLEQLIAVAALQVANELDFDFTIDVANVTITPDPTEVDTRNEWFINLVTVKAACILDRGAASKAAGQAIRIKDGGSEIDLRGVPMAKIEAIKRGWCAVYSELRDDYLTGQDTVVGAAVLSPFRAFVGGMSRQQYWYYR